MASIINAIPNPVAKRVAVHWSEGDITKEILCLGMQEAEQHRARLRVKGFRPKIDLVHIISKFVVEIVMENYDQYVINERNKRSPLGKNSNGNSK